MSGGRFFLDTNIFVYSFEVNSPRKLEIARSLLREASHHGCGVISYQVIQEFFNVAFRRFPSPMSQDDAFMYFNNIFRPILAVSFSPALLFRAIRIRDERKVSWYDSLIFAAAADTECEVLYSEDFQHGAVIEGVRIENPFLKA
jgi:predicted nucleic acid-binding protein